MVAAVGPQFLLITRTGRTHLCTDLLWLFLFYRDFIFGIIIFSIDVIYDKGECMPNNAGGCNIYPYVYIAFFFMSLLWQWTILTNSDELTTLIMHPHHVISTPPPTGRDKGRGQGDDRKRIVYKLTWPPRQSLYNQPSRRPGQPTLGRGPNTWEPVARGRRRPTVHRIKNIV